MPYQTERLFAEYETIRAHVPIEDPSSLNSLDQLYAKVLVISSASEFENEISDLIQKFARESARSPELVTLVRRKAVERQYFQNFDWNAKNLNKFLSLFGGRVESMFDESVASGELDKPDILAFISMNGHRNELVHGNFAASAIDLTPTEVMEKFRRAVRVCATIAKCLGSAAAEPEPSDGAAQNPAAV